MEVSSDDTGTGGVSRNSGRWPWNLTGRFKTTAHNLLHFLRGGVGGIV